VWCVCVGVWCVCVCVWFVCVCVFCVCGCGVCGVCVSVCVCVWECVCVSVYVCVCEWVITSRLVQRKRCGFSCERDLSDFGWHIAYAMTNSLFHRDFLPATSGSSPISFLTIWSHVIWGTKSVLKEITASHRGRMWTKFHFLDNLKYRGIKWRWVDQEMGKQVPYISPRQSVFLWRTRIYAHLFHFFIRTTQ
jgi:hypothetical protein